MSQLPWILKLPSNYYKKSNLDGDNYFVHELSSIIGNVFIGKYSYIHGNTRITTNKDIYIGKYCSIASGVRIQVGDEHDYRRVSTFPFKTILGLETTYNESIGNSVTIGNDVWIGESVRILSGSNINNGVVIGAGSVVKGNLIPYGIYVGNPAKLIKKRFSDPVIDFLQDLKWWDWDDNKIFINSDFFSINLSEVTLDTLYNFVIN